MKSIQELADEYADKHIITTNNEHLDQVLKDTIKQHFMAGAKAQKIIDNEFYIRR